MQRTPFSEISCSIARSLDIVGEWWTPLILRDVFLGVVRFDDLHTDLGISRKVLASRLDSLVTRGVLERRPYQDTPLRHEYALTEMGRDLVPVLLALAAWGDRWTAGEAGPPALIRHTTCGELTTPQVTCGGCGEPLTAGNVHAEPGPGAREGAGTRLLGRVLGTAGE